MIFCRRGRGWTRCSPATKRRRARSRQKRGLRREGRYGGAKGQGGEVLGTLDPQEGQVEFLVAADDSRRVGLLGLQTGVEDEGDVALDDVAAHRAKPMHFAGAHEVEVATGGACTAGAIWPP